QESRRWSRRSPR
ncbi:hypothetical protein TGFOU_402770, partial [Toxoplasma gondii FOU]